MNAEARPVRWKKEILYCGSQVVAACDGKCDKAWGAVRPVVYMYKNPDTLDGTESDAIWQRAHDDWRSIPDSELVEAPACNGTAEGPDTKPDMSLDYLQTARGGPGKLNRWCVRQCERCVTVGRGEPIELPDMDKPFFNMPFNHEAQS